MNIHRITGTLLAAFLLGLLPGCPALSGESDESDETVLFTLLALSQTDSTPATCDIVNGGNTTTAPLYTLNAGGTESFSRGATNGGTHFWTAIHVPNVVNGTTLTFNFNPRYSFAGNLSLVYVEGSCPITSSSNSDSGMNSGTNWSATGNTYTFNSTAAGKDFIFVTSTTSFPDSNSVTRTN